MATIVLNVGKYFLSLCQFRFFSCICVQQCFTWRLITHSFNIRSCAENHQNIARGSYFDVIFQLKWFKNMIISVFLLPVMHPTSAVVVLFCCRNRFGVNPGKCFSSVDCVNGLSGVLAPHCDADNIECSWKTKIKN